MLFDPSATLIIRVQKHELIEYERQLLRQQRCEIYLRCTSFLTIISFLSFFSFPRFVAESFRFRVSFNLFRTSRDHSLRRLAAEKTSDILKTINESFTYGTYSLKAGHKRLTILCNRSQSTFVCVSFHQRAICSHIVDRGRPACHPPTLICLGDESNKGGREISEVLLWNGNGRMRRTCGPSVAC